MALGVEKGYFTENAGQYSLNRKQSPTKANAAENVSDLNFGASAYDNFNVEDQENPTENTINLVNLDILFSNKNEWPQTSATYFTREHNNPGDGKRGLVYNSLIEKTECPTSGAWAMAN